MIPMTQKVINVTTAMTPPITAESLKTAFVSGSWSSVFPKGSDEEYTVVTAFTSESTMEPQLDSLKLPWTVAGAMLACRRAAFNGAM